MQEAVLSNKTTPKSSLDQAHFLVAENAELKQQNQHLQDQLDWFRRQLFGQKSEKRQASCAEQMDISELLEEQKAPEEQADEKQTITYQRKNRNEDCVSEQGLRFDDRVPVKVIEVSTPELSGPDADQYEVIDHKISYRLAQQVSSYVVLEYRHPVLKRKEMCTDTGSKILALTPALITPPALPAVFEGSIADVSVLAGILIDKFAWHLPLYRQHQRLKASGVELSRVTLTTWARRSIDLLTPIYEAQLKHILLSRVLAMDETPIKAGRKKKGKLHQGWLWPIYGETDEICFTFSSTRGTAHLESVLCGFKGVLLTDGYPAYDCYAKNRTEVVQAQCWVHARRYFVEAEKHEPESVAEALEQIGQMYQVEKAIKKNKLSGTQKLEYRIEHSKPLVEAFFEWCHQQRQRIDLTPGNKLSKALVYVANHKDQMSVFLGDPDVPMDTNHVESNLRGIPMGRKNWLFCWTELGAQQVGIIQSLITTCRLHGIDPYMYLVDVLQRVGQHPASAVAELTPRLWKEKFASSPLLSDLDKDLKNGLI